MPINQFEDQDTTFSALLIACDLQRPRNFVKITNTGESTAHELQIKPDSEQYETRFLLLQQEDSRGFTLEDMVPLLSPGDSVYVVLLPTTEKDVHSPRPAISWLEGPTQLRLSHKVQLHPCSGPLQGKKPLDSTERQYATAYVQKLAERDHVDYEKYVTKTLHHSVDELDSSQAPDHLEEIAEHPEVALP